MACPKAEDILGRSSIDIYEPLAFRVGRAVENRVCTKSIVAGFLHL